VLAVNNVAVLCSPFSFESQSAVGASVSSAASPCPPPAPFEGPFPLRFGEFLASKLTFKFQINLVFSSPSPSLSLIFESQGDGFRPPVFPPSFCRNVPGPSLAPLFPLYHEAFPLLEGNLRIKVLMAMAFHLAMNPHFFSAVLLLPLPLSKEPTTSCEDPWIFFFSYLNFFHPVYQPPLLPPSPGPPSLPAPRNWMSDYLEDNRMIAAPVTCPSLFFTSSSFLWFPGKCLGRPGSNSLRFFLSISSFLPLSVFPLPPLLPDILIKAFVLENSMPV